MSRPEEVPKRVVATGADAINSMRRVRDLVRHAVSRLAESGAGFGHGTDNAFDEAVWLVCWSLHLPVEHYADLADATVALPEVRPVLDLLDERCSSGRPLAYLIGEAWLVGFRFRCDSRALVPRSLIAEALTQGTLDAFLPARENAGDETAPLRVLDLCCGGASLAIIAAATFPDAALVASDISAEALELAALNLADYRLGERIRLVEGDLFAGLGRKRFDLIVCNPPYVNQQSMAALPAEYRAEPQAALAGGDDGMDLVARILAAASRHLTPDGLIVLEIGHEARHFERRFPQIEFAYVPVAQGDDRVVAIGAAALKAAAAGRGAAKPR
jgi:ribosomal protein L3 glutamine methyltransferase